jgi:hypothetical protein
MALAARASLRVRRRQARRMHSRLLVRHDALLAQLEGQARMRTKPQVQPPLQARLAVPSPRARST